MNWLFKKKILLLSFLLQCYLGRALLHLCNHLGAGDVHALRHPLCRVRHPTQRDCVHLSRPHIFPAVQWGLSVVVAIYLQCWVSWLVVHNPFFFFIQKLFFPAFLNLYLFKGNREESLVLSSFKFIKSVQKKSSIAKNVDTTQLLFHAINYSRFTQKLYGTKVIPVLLLPGLCRKLRCDHWLRGSLYDFWLAPLNKITDKMGWPPTLGLDNCVVRAPAR